MAAERDGLVIVGGSYAAMHVAASARAGGYAEAIQSQKLLDAISTGPHGAIELAYVEWAGEGEERIVVDWTIIRTLQDAQAFVASLAAFLRRNSSGSIFSA